MNAQIGIIGAGALAEAITTGLSTGLPAGEQPPTIALSPRNEEIAHALADRHPNVHRCPDNHAVVDTAPVLLLTVRPDTVEEVLGTLRVPPDRVVVSAVAGWSVRALRERLDGGPEVVRAIPLPAVRRRRGVTALFPSHPIAHGLFDPLGGTVLAPDEASFGALSAATATISSYLSYMATIASWLTRQGFEEQTADQYVRNVFSGVNGSVAHEQRSLSDLARAHETPGGLNERLRTTWLDPHATTVLRDALDDILDRVSTHLPGNALPRAAPTQPPLP